MTTSLWHNRYGALLSRYLNPLRGKVALLALLIFSTLGLQLLTPQLVRIFIDAALAKAAPQTLLLMALAFLGASLLLHGLTLAGTYLSEDIGWRATNQLRTDLVQRCLRLDMAFHQEYTPGEMVERIDGDVAQIANFFAQFTIRILGNGLLVGGILLVLLREDWHLSLALTLFALLAVAGFRYTRTIAVDPWAAARQANAELFGFLEEHLAGIEDLRANSTVDYVLHHLFQFAKERFACSLRGESMSIWVIWMWFGLQTVGLAIALGTSYLLFRAGLLTVGAVYLVLSYTQSMFAPLRDISNEIQQAQQALASIDRVAKLNALKSKISDGDQQALAVGPLGVAFHAVTFGYTDNPVVQNITFQIKPGQVLGLLGRTGSGKTTLTRLLFRLYEPDQGYMTLEVNGTVLRLENLALPALRQHIGLVTQDVQLFQATLRDNLTFFDPTISDETLWQMLNGLALADWVASLPAGLDTPLETGGRNLSAGEAQLLALGRVFLKNPGLVLLDEASSRLDPATERRLERAIDKLLYKRTGIIIAHRLRTVQRADQIMILENGQIQEIGAYAQLAGDPTSRFAHLLQTGMEERQAG
ncbi:MAG: ABC transporter ATP-binding protein [Caldilineaceae bacterium]